MAGHTQGGLEGTSSPSSMPEVIAVFGVRDAGDFHFTGNEGVSCLT